MWRLHTTFTVFFLVGFAWSVAVGDEIEGLPRQTHLLKAAAHLEAAGLSDQAIEIRRIALTEELRVRINEIKKTLSRADGLLARQVGGKPQALMVESRVLADSLAALRRLQDQINEITGDISVATDKAARNPSVLGVQGVLKQQISAETQEPKMLMLTPGQHRHQMQEEPRILGSIVP